MRSRRAKPGPGHAGHPHMDLDWRTLRVCGQRAPTRVGAARHRRAAEPPSPQGERGEDARPDRASSPNETRRGGLGLWPRVRPDSPNGRPSGRGAWPDGHRLDHDALDLGDGDRVHRPVVELRRLRGGVPGDLLRVFERPPIRQRRRDPRRPERVAAGRGREIHRRRPPLDHRQDETPRERPARQPPPRGVDALEERRRRRVEPGPREVVVERLGRPMVGPGRRAACRPSRGAGATPGAPAGSSPAAASR